MEIAACYLTKTRLMGVTAGYLQYCHRGVNYTEFYHIEYEEYGLDRFEQLINPNEYHIQQLYKEFCGGLGGRLVALTAAEFEQQILAGLSVNIDRKVLKRALRLSHWLTLDFEFSAEVFAASNKKIVERLRSSYERIHYFLMRYFGQDVIYLAYTTAQLTTLAKRYMLIRNTIRKIEGQRYHFSAVILADEHQLIEGELTMTEGLISRLTLSDISAVSDLDIYLLLRQNEYIFVYRTPQTSLMSQLLSQDRALLPMLQKKGILYTAYASNNDHVNQASYFLTDDVEAYIYLADSAELVLMTKQRAALDKWDALLTTRYGHHLSLEAEWQFNDSIFYDYIRSDFEKFDDYLESFGE